MKKSETVEFDKIWGQYEVDIWSQRLELSDTAQGTWHITKSLYCNPCLGRLNQVC